MRTSPGSPSDESPHTIRRQQKAWAQLDLEHPLAGGVSVSRIFARAKRGATVVEFSAASDSLAAIAAASVTICGPEP